MFRDTATDSSIPLKVQEHPRYTLLREIDFSAVTITAELLDRIARFADDTQESLGIACRDCNINPETLSALLHKRVPLPPQDFTRRLEGFLESAKTRMPPVVRKTYVELVGLWRRAAPAYDHTISILDELIISSSGSCSMTDLRLRSGWSLQEAVTAFEHYRLDDNYEAKDTQAALQAFRDLDQPPTEGRREPSTSALRAILDWAKNTPGCLLYTHETILLSPSAIRVISDEQFWELVGYTPQELLDHIMAAPDQVGETPPQKPFKELRVTTEDVLSLRPARLKASDQESVTDILKRARKALEGLPGNAETAEIEAAVSALEKYVNAPSQLTVAAGFGLRMLFRALKPVAASTGKIADFVKQICDDIVDTANKMEDETAESPKSEEMGQGDE